MLAIRQGGGEVARYISSHGTEARGKSRVDWCGATLDVKTDANPAGTPLKAFDDFASGPYRKTARNSGRI